jgi:hypothetical protein
MKMSKIKIGLFVCLVMLCFNSAGQYIRSTIRPGAASNEVDIFITPDFSENSNYMLQLHFAIAFPVDATPFPTGLSITLNPNFISTFGNNYNVGLTALSGSTDPSGYRYYTVTLSRFGAGGDADQTWVAGTEYPVLTAKFLNTNPPPVPVSRVRLVDFEDTGLDGEGNTYIFNGDNTYYYDFDNSQNNFYGLPENLSQDADNMLNGWVQTSTLITLPVSYLNFSGYKSGSKNTLKWTTGSEQNNVGFDVQRSTDGTNYTTIGFVNSLANAGNSTSSLSYTFDDNAPAASKKNYYRLIQKDFDGNGRQSNVVLINGDKPGTVGIGGLFPNPASSQLNVIVDAPSRQDVTLVVMDVMGKTIKQKQVNVEIGSNTVSLEIGNLAAGSYLVKVICKSDCEPVVSKFIKQ